MRRQLLSFYFSRDDFVSVVFSETTPVPPLFRIFGVGVGVGVGVVIGVGVGVVIGVKGCY